METLKRHVFLVGLVAGVVVVSLGVILAVYFVYTRPGSTMRQQIRSTKQRAEALLAGQVYTPELVTEMARQVDDPDGTIRRQVIERHEPDEPVRLLRIQGIVWVREDVDLLNLRLRQIRVVCYGSH
jgi:hypothetical protein